MKPVISLGIASSFFGGAALSLLISYPIPERSLYVCFWALILYLLACLLAVGSFVIWAARKHRIHVDHMVALTVDRMVDHHGLELINGDK